MPEDVEEDPAVEQPLSTRRKRAKPRTALACLFCRQRKARCTGDWPQCRTCKRRNLECSYPGRVPPPPTYRDSDTLVSDDAERTEQLPSLQLRRSAITFFRENYAKSILCFLPPQQLVEDTTGEDLPLPLLLCILALTSRFLSTSAASPAAEQSDHFVDWAKREVDSLGNQPSITNIQCCIILCVVEVGEGLEHQAWLRLGHAIRLAQLARLHKQDTEKTHFDWGDPRPVYSLTELEIQRRTFWSLFCLDRLLANGHDRIATICVTDITTRLPQSDEDFIFGQSKTTSRLTDPVDDADYAPRESLFSYTIRIIDILGTIVLWQGQSGRRQDARCPWLPDMPFTIHSESLALWRKRLPEYWDYKVQNVALAIAAGQGKLWSLMFMFYFQAKTYLYREYLPFIPSSAYDPTIGPCDGPKLIPCESGPPHEWWKSYTITMVESADSIRNLYTQMSDLDLGPTTFPFTGLCLFTAASIHTVFTIFEWDSLRHVINRKGAKEHLSTDMCGFNSLGQHWDIAIHWVRQISLYYKLNYLTHLSFTIHQVALRPSNMKMQAIKDGVMNYLRQISPDDRSSCRMNLKPMFDFEGWLYAIESDWTRTESQQTSHLSTRLASPVQSDLRHDGEQDAMKELAAPQPYSLIEDHATEESLTNELDAVDSFQWFDTWNNLGHEAAFWDDSLPMFPDIASIND